MLNKRILQVLPIQRGRFGEAINLHPDNCKCHTCVRLREWRASQC